MSLIYLASPYSHEDPKVREERFNNNIELLFNLHGKNYNIFSPILHGHELTKKLCKVPTKEDIYLAKHWSNFNDLMLSKCDKFWIFCLDGWKESVGVRKEYEMAKALNLPMAFININLQISPIWGNIYVSKTKSL